MYNLTFHIKNFAWLTAAQIVSKVVSLFVLPIITYYLSPNDFGTIAMFAVVQTLLGNVFSMGLHTYAGRIIAKYERTQVQECKEYLGSIFVYILLFSFVGVAISLIFIDQIFQVLLSNMKLPSRLFIYIPIAMAFVMNIHGFSTSSLLNLQLNKKCFFIELMQFVLFMPFQIIGLTLLGFTVWDVLFLQLVVQVIVTFYGLWYMKDWLSFRRAKMGIFREAMRFSLPMVPLGFAGWIQERIDKIIISNNSSLSSVGVYAAGTNIANQYSFFSRPIAITIKTEMLKRLDSEHPKIQEDIRDSFAFFFQVSILLYLLISLFSKEIVMVLMNKRFYECYRIVPIFLLSIIFSELTGIFQVKFFFRNKTMWFPASLVFAAIMNAYLNLILIPRYDIYGAAFAKTLSELAVLFTTYFMSQYFHKTDYRLLRNFIPLFAVVGIVFAIEYIEINYWIMVIVKLSIIVLYFAIFDYYFKRNNARYHEVRCLLVDKIQTCMH
jgi:O-antigen/teichoic acid export membrane protein